RAARLLAHPLERRDALGEHRAQIGDEIEDPLLRLRRERAIDVETTEGMRKLRVDHAEHALPARLLLGLADERRAEEVEGGALERARQVRREGAHEVPAEVRAPRLERTSTDEPVERGEEGGLPHVEL